MTNEQEGSDVPAKPFPWLPDVLERYGVALSPAAVPDALELIEASMANLSVTERHRILQAAATTFLNDRRPLIWATVDALRCQITLENLEELYRAGVAGESDPLTLCELGRALLDRGGIVGLPLGPSDFGYRWAEVGDPPITLSLPSPHASEPTPVSVEEEVLERSVAARLAIRSFGLACISLVPVMTDARAEFDWDSAWLGLLALEGLRSAFHAADDAEGLVATIICMDAWCERIRGRFNDVAEEFLPGFEQRVEASLNWLSGRYGAAIGDALSCRSRRMSRLRIRSCARSFEDLRSPPRSHSP